MKQSVYYMHVPRTSGTFIVKNLREQKPDSNIVAGHRYPISLDTLEQADYIAGHYSNTPVKFADKTFTIMRDPVERTFSYIKGMASVFYSHMPLDDTFTLFLNNEITKKNISNQHSKFFSGFLNLEKYNRYVHNQREMILKGWNLVDYKTNAQDVIEHLSNNNIQVLQYSDPELYSKVFSILDMIMPDDVVTHVNSSQKISQELYDKYKSQIEDINQLDIELYEYFKAKP